MACTARACQCWPWYYLFRLLGGGRMTDDLTFVINPEAESASFGLLFKSLEDIGRLLREVDRGVYGPKSRNQWIVRSLKSSAPTITVEPDLNGREAAEAVGVGLRNLMTGVDHPPQYFTEQVLLNLQKMKRLFGGQSGATSITVWMNGQQTASIERDISQRVSRILNAGYHNFGSLEGTLEAINVHGMVTATIWDRVSRSPVRCSMPKYREWITRIKDLLEKRVTVTGDIHYFVNGIPRFISNVTDIQDATPDPSWPRAEFGSIPDMLVREVGAAEWLKAVRGVSEG